MPNTYPDNWYLKSIAELGNYQDATVQTGPFGAQLHSDDYVEEGVPFILIRNIQDNGLDLRNMPKISHKDAIRLSMYSLKPGDIVFSRVGRVGSCFLVEDRHEGWIISGQMLRIRLPSDTIHPAFLVNSLRSKRAQDYITGASVGSTRKSINTSILESLRIAVPPLPDQRAIAHVLDTIDEAIRIADQTIIKMQHIKSGLLHDLLTYGIDENGDIRNPERHPEEFKDSPLGLIPRAWETYQLQQIVPRADYGISVSLEDTTGIPVLRMNNLKDGEISLTDLKMSNSLDAQSLLLQHNDVLFNRTNSIEHVGRTGIWRGQLEKATFASYLVRLVPDLNKLLPGYLNQWLNLPEIQIAIRKYATPGVQQVNINPTNLRKVHIALPDNLDEQQEIVDLADYIRFQLDAELHHRDKLIAVKQGLMDDLLTGRVRVTDVAIARIVEGA